MWERVELKSKAKKFLSRFYVQAFFVSLLIMIVTGSNNGRGNGSNNGSGVNWRVPADGSGFIQSVGNEIAPFYLRLGMGIGIGLLILGFVIALRVFLGYPLEVGGRRFFLKGAEGDTQMGYVGSLFKDENYMNVVVTMLYKGVLNFLFYLLLIIPGIIKSYAYAMVPYILSDNPSIDRSRAIELSEEMTMGHKFDMFVLDLSFLGWYILGALAFGIGILFVNPYVDATHAQLYIKLREIAFKANYATPAELGLHNYETPESEDDWYTRIE